MRKDEKHKLSQVTVSKKLETKRAQCKPKLVKPSSGTQGKNTKTLFAICNVCIHAFFVWVLLYVQK